jgi:hypothetical protein
MADFPAKFIPAHRPYGFKPAYQLTISNEELKPLVFEEIASEIKSAL